MKRRVAQASILISILSLFGCGESDFTGGIWTSALGDPAFQCRGNLQVLAVEPDRVRFVSLGQVLVDWQGLKTQFRQNGDVVLKGREGGIFRFRSDGPDQMTLEDAPEELASIFDVPVDLVNCASVTQ